tara:strand:- start:31 stop:189 length:159 start_codon:yes stop_codon:yes gene_type:complete
LSLRLTALELLAQMTPWLLGQIFGLDVNCVDEPKGTWFVELDGTWVIRPNRT